MAKILIIGGGVSGLAAGISALKSGHSVEIHEKQHITGGNLTAWNRKGFTVDTCIHWLTGTNPASPFYKMWEDLGALDGNTEIYRPEFLFTVEHGGQSLSLYRDLDRTVGRMLEISPADKAEIMSFKKAAEFFMGYLGTYGPEHDHKFTGSEMVPYLPSLLKYYLHDIGEISDRFKHPLLKKFLVSLMGRDFCAVDLAFVVATFTSGNADMPSGISRPVAERMTQKYKELGGSLYLNDAVVKLEYDGKTITGAVTEKGEKLTADYYIAAMNPFVLFESMTDVPMPSWLKRMKENKNYRLFSSFHVEFSADVDAKDVPFKENLFLDIPEEYRELLGSDRMILREFSHEPGFSADGRANLQAMIYCREDGCRRFIGLREKREAYQEFKKNAAEAVAHIIGGRFPELEGKLTCLDVWTPATFKRFTGAPEGTYMSFIPPKRTIPKRYPNRPDRVDNLILASQWQMPPGGLPVAAGSGIVAVQTVDMQAD